MKNVLKRALALFLTIVMTIGIAPLSGFVGIKLSDLFNVKSEAATASVGTLKKIFGTVSSSKKVTVVLKLKKGSDVVDTISVTEGKYEFSDLENGEYILEANAVNHIEHKYEITIGSNDVELDVSLNILGDINGDGKINTIDVARVNSHAKSITKLSDYELTCADVTGDGKVNTIDVARINSHAKGVSFIDGKFDTDITAPVITALSITQQGQTLKAGDTLTLNLSITEESDISTCQIVFKNTTTGTTINASSSMKHREDGKYSYAYKITDNMSSGKWVFSRAFIGDKYSQYGGASISNESDIFFYVQ